MISEPVRTRASAREGFCQALKAIERAGRIELSESIKGISAQYAQVCARERESTIKNIAISMTCFEKQMELIKRRGHAQE